jgi:ribosomal protein S9
MGVIHKIGRRKCAVARVYVSEGTGKITVNKREFSNYFPTATLQYKVMQPMSMTENATNFDVKVNVYGGGAPGTVDAGYRGELQCIMINHDPKEAITFHKGDRIAQLVIQKVERAEFVEVEELPGSGRGSGGFGSGVASISAARS